MAAENPVPTSEITNEDRANLVAQLGREALLGNQSAFAELDTIALGGNLNAQQLIRALDNKMADEMVGAAEDSAV